MKGKSGNLRDRFYSEARFSGLGRADLMMEFYSRIAALLRASNVVLDHGAGRGAQIAEDKVPCPLGLKMLQERCPHLNGCDIDDAVLGNPCFEAATLFDPGEALLIPTRASTLLI